MGREKKISYWKRSLQGAARLDAKGERKVLFGLYIFESHRFTSAGVLTEGCGPKERIKPGEVSEL